MIPKKGECTKTDKDNIIIYDVSGMNAVVRYDT